MTQTIRLSGSLEANESVQIRAEIAGLIREINFEEGEEVEAGRLLFQIDDLELRAQLAQAEARLRLAQDNLVRSQNLSDSKVISESELDSQKTEFDQAKAELDLIRVRLEKTSIRAPFAGAVGSRQVSAGDYVAPDTDLTRLDDLSRLKISFSIPERYYSQVAAGSQFEVASAGIDGGELDRVRGEIYFLARSISRETRAAEAKGFVLEPPAGLRPGMFANVELVLAENRDLLAVPEAAVLTTTDGSSVVAVRDDQEGGPVADFVKVKLGVRSDGFVAVEPAGGELAEDQPIVASGVGGLILFPGAKLEPREAPAP